MKSLKKISRRKLLIIILGGSVFALALMVYFNFKQPVQNITEPTVDVAILMDQRAENINLPVRLKIPGIGVDAVVESLGLTVAGAMEVPKGPDNVAWYELGTRPGEQGSAVIAGHYGKWKNGQGSVFDDLHKLNKGDKLYIEDDKGVVIAFVVRESRNYDPTADAVEVFSSDDELAHLNLITCEGTWNKATKSFSQRLVVFADRE